MSPLLAMSIPALVIPDDQTWTVLLDDPATRGLAPVDSPAAAEFVLLPAEIPSVLVEPLSRLLLQVPAGAAFERVTPAKLGDATRQSLFGEVAQAPPERARAGEIEAAASHDGEDSDDGDGDMMAIVGEPSADGLVMESMTVQYGPLGTSLPGGLLVEATLDGDVVAEASIAALLEAIPANADESSAVPDRLAPVAWTAAIAADGSDASTASLHVAPTEIERATSHLAWLRALGRILDWPPLITSCTDALRPLTTAGRPTSGPQDVLEALAAARENAAEIDQLLRRSRTLRWRTAGLGVVSERRAREIGLAGPNARASGLARDARDRDPRYAELGFEQTVRFEGDVLARVLVRSEEVVQALALAETALRLPEVDAAADSGAVIVEAARGPVRAARRDGGWRFEAPGAAAARQVAAEAMAGEEWGSALAILASFDLSPWSVGR